MIINKIDCVMSSEQVVVKSFIEDFKHKSRLIVDDSQVAIFYKDGKALDQFGPGDYALDTNNLPLLTKIVNSVLGIQSVFSCHVYFVKKSSSFDFSWGTKGEPAMVKDPSTGISCKVRALGQAIIKIKDGDERKFIAKVVGQESVMEFEAVKSKIKGVIVALVKNALTRSIQNSSTPITEVQGRSLEIADGVKIALNEDLQDYGIEVEKFYITDIEFDERDYAKIQESEQRRLAIDDEAYKMDALSGARARARAREGYTYQEERKFDVFDNMANNQGPAGGFMNMGMGLGMGMNMAREMSGAMGSVAATSNPAPTQGAKCPACNAVLAEGAKFCATCGMKIEVKKNVCPDCGMALPEGAKFCANCGCKVEKPLAVFCSECGTKCESGTKFCPTCGNRLGESIKKV